ncbi:hypothetical protein GLOIN_2v1027721 [Rhizophagus clarus]|uniref:Uncharacterized protein n=1 Tax=Rhizophagus clarus TaxID=94130 RepID=A0A8H3M5T3_9GLOM|nr:hypothetical protein GLOIN_2v1027721 [Rhizophagus clarus]
MSKYRKGVGRGGIWHHKVFQDNKINIRSLARKGGLISIQIKYPGYDGKFDMTLMRIAGFLILIPTPGVLNSDAQTLMLVKAERQGKELKVYWEQVIGERSSVVGKSISIMANDKTLLQNTTSKTATKKRVIDDVNEFVPLEESKSPSPLKKMKSVARIRDENVLLSDRISALEKTILPRGEEFSMDNKNKLDRHNCITEIRKLINAIDNKETVFNYPPFISEELRKIESLTDDNKKQSLEKQIEQTKEELTKQNIELKKQMESIMKYNKEEQNYLEKKIDQTKEELTQQLKQQMY